ncbi:type I restriction enzyme HsdR N-terminal domain-containing protein [Bradyrhizobium sp. SYSU BS000235]|uniref:type I restriction enzyme HsdR N-terminal domain-containing protein n=1 Tax=Bradyrhizobium sp. SYSU BS000235 TaxID=3411332 RepID=UPI003C7379CC
MIAHLMRAPRQGRKFFRLQPILVAAVSIWSQSSAPIVGAGNGSFEQSVDAHLAQIKKYQGILNQAKKRDVSEADTVVIVNDILSDALGYDKYEHVTSETAVRGTFVDLAVVVDNRTRFFVEVKAINIELKDNHVKQAIDYAANAGVDWVVLTNGLSWRVYKVQFGKPIDKFLACEIDLLNSSYKDDGMIACFANLSREGFSKDTMSDFLLEKQITNKFSVAAVLTSPTIVEHIRREIRRLSGIRVDEDYLNSLLSDEIVKRELVEGEEARAAQKSVQRMQRALDKERKKAAEANLVLPSQSNGSALSAPSRTEAT